MFNPLNYKIMKTKKNVFRLNRMLMAIAFILSSMTVNAQYSWDWGDCLDWLRYEGFETLATYAHPTNDLKNYYIEESSPDVIVRFDFDGTFVDFSATYKIVRAFYNGKPYFKDVKVLREHSLIRPFTAWSSYPRLHPQIYKDNNFYVFYDGVTSFEELPLGKQAAAALTMEFVAKQ